MAKINLSDYLLFMFSMKGVGRYADFNHVKDKVARDVGKFSDEQIKKIIDELINKNFLKQQNEKFGVTQEGKEFFASVFSKLENNFLKINKPWTIVYKAKQYYPVVADTVVEFCKNRYTGFYCLFTQQRFFRRDFGGKKIAIKTPKDLLFFIDIHYIDVIPCVHKIGSERPDWLVVDIDAGDKITFEQTKKVTEIAYKIFEKFDLNPALKFSGSRGFQIWSLIRDFSIPKEYQPVALTSNRKRDYFSLFSDFIRIIQKEVDQEIPGLTTTDVGKKERREDKILFDTSSMKPMGLVRSPYSVHSKTGLVSLPLMIKELKTFQPEHATTEKVIERYEKKGNEFLLKESNPDMLIRKLV